MKLLLFACALLGFSYFHPSHGDIITEDFGDCSAGEYKTVEVTCTGDCKVSTASAFYNYIPSGVVHIWGRFGGKPYEKTTCNDDCFCKGDADVSSQQQCNSMGNTILGSKINFVLRCQVESFNVWLQLNVNGVFVNHACTMPIDHNGPRACALNIGHLGVKETRHYTITCNNDCKNFTLYTEFDYSGDVDHLGDVDLYLGETIYDNSSIECSHCFCSATSDDPTRDDCRWQKRISKNKVILTVKGHMPSSNVVVYYKGNNIESVVPYNPQKKTTSLETTTTLNPNFK